ncbi:MAG: hypothetical protein P9L94_11970 [Candidatus Hinthialibacter antarcticus]|nr:hypothetical protein [Candidatus Hinthialibacter antarcticus]
MALNAINPNLQSTSLFRPVPASQLQQNLAEHFQRTADFVDENFQEMREATAKKVESDAPKLEEPQQRASLRERIRPAGLGAQLDIFV